MPDLQSEGNQGKANRGRERMDTHLEFLELSALVPAAFPLFFMRLMATRRVFAYSGREPTTDCMVDMGVLGGSGPCQLQRQTVPKEPSPKALMGVKERIEAAGGRRVGQCGRRNGTESGEMDGLLCAFLPFLVTLTVMKSLRPIFILRSLKNCDCVLGCFLISGSWRSSGKPVRDLSSSLPLNNVVPSSSRQKQKTPKTSR